MFCILVSLAAIGHTRAQTQPDIYDFFRLGEIIDTCASSLYNTAIADQIAEKYEEHLQFLRKLGAPEKLVSSFMTFRDVAIRTPWKKSKREWSDAERDAQSKAWQHGVLDPDARDEWLKTLADHGFHYTLGGVSMMAAYIIGHDILDRGDSISAQSSSIHSAGAWSKILQTNASFAEARSKANPAVLGALTKLTSIVARMDDPLAGGELTTADITAIRDAGLQLRSLARDKKLLK
jgi:hypothetical protein